MSWCGSKHANLDILDCCFRSICLHLANYMHQYMSLTREAFRPKEDELAYKKTWTPYGRPGSIHGRNPERHLMPFSANAPPRKDDMSNATTDGVLRIYFIA